jgi:hypothetical protein
MPYRSMSCSGLCCPAKWGPIIRTVGGAAGGNAPGGVQELVEERLVRLERVPSPAACREQSSSSMQSPGVMSATSPPLVASITAIRSTAGSNVAFPTVACLHSSRRAAIPMCQTCRP